MVECRKRRKNSKLQLDFTMIIVFVHRPKEIRKTRTKLWGYSATVLLGRSTPPFIVEFMPGIFTQVFFIDELTQVFFWLKSSLSGCAGRCNKAQKRAKPSTKSHRKDCRTENGTKLKKMLLNDFADVRRMQQNSWERGTRIVCLRFQVILCNFP